MSLDPVKLAQDLIRCPSVTPTDAGVMAVLETALTKLGFTCHRMTFADAPGQATENLYARLGTEAPNLCFAGHVDVVPPGDITKWSVDPFAAVIQGDYLIGRGAEDMKSAIACFVAAASQYGAPKKGSISLLITGDEEGEAINGTRKMLGWLKQQNETIDACIVGEPTNPNVLGEMAKIGRRGSAYGILTVIGKQGHSAYPALADNPVTTIVDMLYRLKNTPLDGGSKFFPASNLEVTTIDVGNPTGNVIPGMAAAKFSVRFNDQHDAISIESWIRKQLDATNKPYELKWRVSGESFLTPPGRLSDIIQEATQEIVGIKPELSTTGGTSDARFIKNICPVVEFGTTGATAHMIDERVLVKDIMNLAAIYKATLKKFFA